MQECNVPQAAVAVNLNFEFPCGVPVPAFLLCSALGKFAAYRPELSLLL